MAYTKFIINYSSQIFFPKERLSSREQLGEVPLQPGRAHPSVPGVETLSSPWHRSFAERISEASPAGTSFPVNPKHNDRKQNHRVCGGTPLERIKSLLFSTFPLNSKPEN